jgi:hypothetical protein
MADLLRVNMFGFYVGCYWWLMVALCSPNNPVNSPERCKKSADCVCAMFSGLVYRQMQS